MTTFFSALFTGAVVHRRSRPRRHRLRYRAFWMLLDLDELPALSASLRLFSHNRFNLLSFYDRDHGDRSGGAPRLQVEAHLQAAGIETDNGPISLFCMPRILGYAFNPLSIYFCHRPNGTLAAILYEVTNTFRERHSYLMPVDPGQGMAIRQHCEKRLYVSPFMDMEMRYEFRVRPPGDVVGVAINGLDANGPIIETALRGRRQELSDRALAGVLARHGLQTIKVVAGIHYEALLLWFKGAGIRPRPAAPEMPVTVGGTDRA
jgi:DUF1365 family protein